MFSPTALAPCGWLVHFAGLPTGIRIAHLPDAGGARNSDPAAGTPGGLLSGLSICHHGRPGRQLSGHATFAEAWPSPDRVSDRHDDRAVGDGTVRGVSPCVARNGARCG